MISQRSKFNMLTFSIILSVLSPIAYGAETGISENPIPQVQALQDEVVGIAGFNMPILASRFALLYRCAPRLNPELANRSSEEKVQYVINALNVYASMFNPQMLAQWPEVYKQLQKLVPTLKAQVLKLASPEGTLLTSSMSFQDAVRAAADNLQVPESEIETVIQVLFAAPFLQAQEATQKHLTNLVNSGELDKIKLQLLLNSDSKTRYSLEKVYIRFKQKQPSKQAQTAAADHAEKIQAQLKSELSIEAIRAAYQHPETTDSEVTIQFDLQENTTLKDLPTPFLAPVFNLREPGAVSTCIETSTGWVVFRLVQIKVDPTYLQTEYKFQTCLLKSSALKNDEEAEAQLNTMKEKIEAKSVTLGELAKAYSEEAETAVAQGITPWIEAGNPRVIELAGNAKPLAQNVGKDEILGPFKAKQGWRLTRILEKREHDTELEHLEDLANNYLAYQAQMEASQSSEAALGAEGKAIWFVPQTRLREWCEKA